MLLSPLQCQLVRVTAPSFGRGPMQLTSCTRRRLGYDQVAEPIPDDALAYEIAS